MSNWSSRCLIIILIATLSACNTEPTPPLLRIGFNTLPGYEFIYLAKVKNFYAQKGIDVQLIELNSLGEVRRALETGQIDIMASTMVEVIIAAENMHQPVTTIAVSDASSGADTLLVNKSSNISDPANLKGKRIGLEAATVDVLVASAALKQAGLTLQDTQVITGTQDKLVLDFEAGKIDALQTYPPYSVKLMKTGKYVSIFNTTKIPEQIIDVLSVTEKTRASRASELKKFLAAYWMAFEYFTAHREESAAIMGKREGISAEEFLGATDDIKLYGQPDQPDFFVGGKAKSAYRHALSALTTSKVIHTTMNENDFVTQPQLP